MNVTVFQANDGDCLLLTGADGKTMLVDGGRKDSYRAHVAPALGEMAQAQKALDVVCLSHVDDDHIAGILQMVDDFIDWRAYDFAVQSGNKRVRKPKFPRPPEVRALWHNGFQDEVVADMGRHEELLSIHMQACLLDQALIPQAEAYQDLVTGYKEAERLSSLVSPNLLAIPVNPPFKGGLMHVANPPVVIPLGAMQISIIGPFLKDLEKLKKEWEAWSRDNQEALEKVREDARREAERLHLDEGEMLHRFLFDLAAELGQREKVTPPNLASLMLLVEEEDKTLLLTGDGHCDDILQGLRAHKKITDQQGIHVNVLKVQHHGAEYNINEEFCRWVTADHYIFCGNGSSGNPNLDVLQLIVDSRLLPEKVADSKSPQADQPFKFWFNSSSKIIPPADRWEHMQKVEKLVRKAAKASHGKMKYTFLTKGFKLPPIVL